MADKSSKINIPHISTYSSTPTFFHQGEPQTSYSTITHVFESSSPLEYPITLETITLESVDIPIHPLFQLSKAFARSQGKRLDLSPIRFTISKKRKPKREAQTQVESSSRTNPQHQPEFSSTLNPIFLLKRLTEIQK